MRAAAKSTFQIDRFFSAVDIERRARTVPWRRVAAESGVSASTLTRMSKGHRPDVNSIAALAIWAGLSMDEFVLGSKQQESGRPLAAISAAIRRDASLTTESAALLEVVLKAVYEELRA